MVENVELSLFMLPLDGSCGSVLRIPSILLYYVLYYMINCYIF